MNTNRPPAVPAGMRAPGPRPPYPPGGPPQYSQSQYQQPQAQYSQPQYTQTQYSQQQQQRYSQSQPQPAQSLYPSSTAQYSAGAVRPLVPRPGQAQPTQGQAIANAANVDGIGNAIAVKNAGREAKIGALVGSPHHMQALNRTRDRHATYQRAAAFTKGARHCRRCQWR